MELAKERIPKSMSRFSDTLGVVRLIPGEATTSSERWIGALFRLGVGKVG